MSEKLQFPLEYELRIIYKKADNSDILADVARVMTKYKAALGAPVLLDTKSDTYGRVSCAVRFRNKAAMYAAYGDIGALAGVKTVL